MFLFVIESVLSTTFVGENMSKAVTLGVMLCELWNDWGMIHQHAELFKEWDKKWLMHL